MVTRKRKGGKIATKTRRNIKRRLRNIDSTAEGINASQLVLTKQQQRASEVLDAAVNATANQIRVGSKALAKVAQDPEAMKSLSETIEAVGNATAKVAENSGEITADMVEKFGPAFKQWVFAGSDMIQDTLFDAIMGIVGAVPVVGDVAATAGQILDSGNENFWQAYWAAWKAFPHAVNIAGKSVNKFGEAAEDFGKVGKPVDKLANNIGKLADNIDAEVAKAGKGKSKKGKTIKKQAGGKKYRRKKGTKKKARRKKRHHKH
tara:strand:- start:1504 stop:2289 length:786 start_codon:yes stop_codon:yes gene_type:complete